MFSFELTEYLQARRSEMEHRYKFIQRFSTQGKDMAKGSQGR